MIEGYPREKINTHTLDNIINTLDSKLFWT